MKPTVKVITESSKGRVLEVDAAPESALIDVCDEHRAPIPFSCRVAACGTCRVHVLEGAAELAPPEQDELDLLSVFHHEPGLVRLTCQAKLRAGATRVHLKAFHEE